jgi:hypothetical protein
LSDFKTEVNFKHCRAAAAAAVKLRIKASITGGTVVGQLLAERQLHHHERGALGFQQRGRRRDQGAAHYASLAQMQQQNTPRVYQPAAAAAEKN